MRNHSYCDYLNNEHFLESVDQYLTDYDNDFETIKDVISRKVRNHINNAHGDHYDINDYIAQAKSLLNILRHINETLNQEVSQ